MVFALSNLRTFSRGLLSNFVDQIPFSWLAGCCKNNVVLNSFPFRVVRRWNNLPQEIVSTRTPEAVAAKLRRFDLTAVMDFMVKCCLFFVMLFFFFSFSLVVFASAGFGFFLLGFFLCFYVFRTLYMYFLIYFCN